MSNEDFAFRVVVATLSLILIAVIGAMLFGLFHPSVDNSEVFAIIGPSFQTVVGAFVGVLSMMVRGRKKGDGE